MAVSWSENNIKSEAAGAVEVAAASTKFKAPVAGSTFTSSYLKAVVTVPDDSVFITPTPLANVAVPAFAISLVFVPSLIVHLTSVHVLTDACAPPENKALAVVP